MSSPPAGAVSTAITGIPAALAASTPWTIPAASIVPRMMPSYPLVRRIFHLRNLVGDTGFVRQCDHIHRHAILGSTCLHSFLQELPEGVRREDLHECKLVGLVALDWSVGGHWVGGRSGILRGSRPELEIVCMFGSSG
ncbi:MAG: hypothetical protein R2848_03630 [Thermomicrobiales bacterium]